jgi:hypothetical protein
MINRLVALLLALHVSILPAFAAVSAGSAPKNSGSVRAPGALSGSAAAPSLSLSAPALGLTPSATPLPAPALIAFARLETPSAASLSAAAADHSPAGVFVSAVAARPPLLADEDVRAEAVRVLGAEGLVRLESAVAGLDAAAAKDASLASALATFRREAPAVSPAKAQIALALMSAAFGTMNGDGAAASAPSTDSGAILKPAARRSTGLRRFVLAALTAATIANPLIAVAQPQLPAGQDAPYSVLTSPAHGVLQSLLAQAGQRQAEVVQFRTADELVSRYNGPGLYVSGDVGLDQAALRRLSAYLADKHWTVVLVADGQGFSWRDRQGGMHYGDAAIEFATGQGIFAKDAFTGQVNAQTGQRDGSILTIVLQQRVLLLRNSEAQKTRGLDGETRFRGHLDQWAISNMRNGGDIYGAVTETIENVDRLLSSAIAQEARSAASAVAEAKALISRYEAARPQFVSRFPSASVGAADLPGARRAVAEAEQLIAGKNNGRAVTTANAAVRQLQQALDQMSGFETAAAAAGQRLAAAAAEVTAVERAAASFRDAHRGATGDLARPDVRGWRESLEAATRQKASDPRAAEAAASSVIAQARAVAEGIAQFEAGGRQLAAAQNLQSELTGREHAGAASERLTAAEQALRATQSALEDGSSAWKGHLAQAQNAQSEAEQLINAAAASARNAAILFWSLMALLSLLTLGGALLLNRRAARAGRKASEALAKWDKILETKLEAIYGGSKPGEALNSLEAKIDTYVGPVSGPQARGWVGETEKLAAAIRKDSGYAKLLLAKARSVHDMATALTRPSAWTSLGWWRNQFWPSGYALAERLLSTEPVEFKPGDPLIDASGKKSDWREDLYGEASSYEPFKLSFDEVMKRFNASAKAAVDAVTRLEHAVTQSGAVFDGVDASISKAAKTQASLAAADGLFSAAALYEKALPAASEQVKQARVTAQKDPIQGVEGGGAEAARIVRDAEALAAALKAARAGSLAAADAAAAVIAANEVDNVWIEQQKKELSNEADAIAKDAASKDVSARVAGLTAKLDDLKARAEDIAAGTKALGELRKAMNATEAAAAAARETIAAALSLDAADILVEKGSNPTEFIAKGRELAESTDQLLGQGKLAEAKKVFADAERNARAAAEVVAAGLKSLETHSQVEQARKAETERLESLVPQRQRVLASIEADFAASVLALSSGDASHPNSNGTVKDNVDEASAAIEAATAKREQSLRAFRDGKVILAADLLSQAAAHQAVAQHRLDEIAEKRARLDKAVAVNASQRAALETKAKEYVRTVAGDRRAMKPTLQAFKSAQQGLSQAAELVDQAKGDPFKAAAALASAAAALEQVWVSARNDFDQHAELERSLQAAYRQLGAAGQLAQKAGNDGTADSPAITAAYRELGSLEQAYKAAIEVEKASHGDWRALDAEADRITNAASHVAATLNHELAAAASATQAVSSASAKVREASNWTGSHGVYIPGSPGSGSLESARAALSRGDYQGAVSHAESARRAAASAISQAEAQVAAAIAEERRRREAEERERRRRQQEEEDRRRRSSSSGSSYGSSSGSGGSSWGGSSSGSGRSGW